MASKRADVVEFANNATGKSSLEKTNRWKITMVKTSR